MQISFVLSAGDSKVKIGIQQIKTNSNLKLTRTLHITTYYVGMVVCENVIFH